MSSFKRLGLAALLILSAGSSGRAPKAPTLTWIPGSTVKLQQLIGGSKSLTPTSPQKTDLDWQTDKPLLNKTYTHYNVGGCDLGYSFEHKGTLVFLFGDTIGPVHTDFFYAGDTIASSTSTDPESGLALEFFTLPRPSPQQPNEPRNADRTYTLLVEPVHPNGKYVDMGPFNVPAAGISIGGRMYVVCITGYPNYSSVLTRFDEQTKTFHAGRTISHLPGGHFTNMALVTGTPAISPTTIFMFGLATYRKSQVYLARIGAEHFWSGTTDATQGTAARPATQFFTGLDRHGAPTWSEQDAAAVPIVKDVVDPPTIGNVSVIYERRLGLFLMTFDSAGRGNPTSGTYFCYAREPWGPWSAPQLINNMFRDKEFGYFIHWAPPGRDQPGTYLAGPTIGGADPVKTGGGTYAPYMVGRFTRVEGKKLSLYYTESTWNPYTIVLCRSDFTIGQ